MTEKKLIAVVGATGSQGAGLVRAILSNPDGEFAVRARSPAARSPEERRSWRGRGPRSSRRTSTTRRACVTRSRGPTARTS